MILKKLGTLACIAILVRADNNQDIVVALSLSIDDRQQGPFFSLLCGLTGMFCPTMTTTQVPPSDPGSIRTTLVGSLSELFHDVSGDVYTTSEGGIRVQNFFYDGTAPAAYFWAGSTSGPNQNGHILPYPFTGTFYRSNSMKAPVLGRLSNVTVNLRLPPELPLSHVRWLSVWCRTFRVDFGSITFL